MQVTKVGDSLAVVLPDSVVEDHKLKAGDEVDIEVKSAGVTSASQGSSRAGEEALERLREVRRTLPSGYKFDREEANAR